MRGERFANTLNFWGHIRPLSVPHLFSCVWFCSETIFLPSSYMCNLAEISQLFKLLDSCIENGSLLLCFWVVVLVVSAGITFVAPPPPVAG